LGCKLPSLSSGGRVLAEGVNDADFWAYSRISCTQSQEYAAVFDIETRRGVHEGKGTDFPLSTLFSASVIPLLEEEAIDEDEANGSFPICASFLSSLHSLNTLGGEDIFSKNCVCNASFP
jgi:hypothetical protein